VQKLFSVLLIWVLLYAVSVPYLIVLASGTNLGPAAVFYVGIYGTILVIGVSLISLVFSARMKSSKNSIMTALMVVLILLAPSLFFATSLKKTEFGMALENVNPVSHAMDSLDSVLVDNEKMLYQQINHIWPMIGFVVVCTLVFMIFTTHFEIKGADQ
jgi:ABC-type transport system involved in multi-copper enzyme maturation permease subunit